MWLSVYLSLVGYSALLAFAAALMPEHWMTSITESMGLKSFATIPVAFYLARHLSLLYGFIGGGLVYLTRNLNRFRDLIGTLAVAVIALGILQGIIDLQAGMPLWWTLGESISTIIGGLIMHWLHRHCDSSQHDA
ncbi:hypothetical protein CGZ80_23410 [Rhodopirellula sp. MGV]|nr:hypothetical protein CGZ80_23410 [Rhodopirellula sp. MGV]PNY33484.1 hypothetical protein C2E31_28420 [Rhodopirellula baltica]